jgi:hypothetical protein
VPNPRLKIAGETWRRKLRLSPTREQNPVCGSPDHGFWRSGDGLLPRLQVGAGSQAEVFLGTDGRLWFIF